MTINCPICREQLQPEQYNDDSHCRNCRARLHCTAYPALTRDSKVIRPEKISEQNQAGCFYHPAQQAVVDCAHCGRFLCALCDLEVGEKHLCPSCLGRGKDGQSLLQLNQGLVRYDILTLALSLWPLLLFMPLIVLTAPLTLYLVFKHYNKPISITPVNRWRFWVAAVSAAGQLIGLGVLAYVFLPQ